MQEEKTHSDTQTGGKFIDSLIGQWIKRTGNNIVFHQMEKTTENPIMQEGKQILQNQEHIIQSLQRRLKQSQETEASLTASLESEMHNKEELEIKLNGTWETIDTITEYFNYISESLANFQQHRANLSTMYDKVILEQQQAIQKLQLNKEKSKELEQHVTQWKNKSMLQEEKLQEATAEQNKLRKQLEDSASKLHLQKNELVNTYAEEKLNFVKEQQRLLLEYENMQLRLKTIEKEKGNVEKSVVELENKLLFQEEKVQEALAEQDKLREQLENNKNEFYSQKNNLEIAHTEEKEKLVGEQRRLLAECKSLQSQLQMMEQDKTNIAEIVVQKDILLSELRVENSTYKDQMEMMTESNNEMHIKYTALVEKQDMWEKELRTNTEKIQNLEMALEVAKRKKANLVNDLNKMEEKLTNKIDYCQKLENKFSDAQRDLQVAQKHRNEAQKTLEKTKTTNQLANIEFQEQLKTLQKEKEESVKQENMRIKSQEIFYENIQTKHAEEISALKSTYETRLLELRKTIDQLNETTNSIRKENSVLTASLTEMRAENSSLRNNNELIMNSNKDLQNKLKEIAESNQNDRSKSAKTHKQSNAKRKYDPAVTDKPEIEQSNITTFTNPKDDKQFKLLTETVDNVYTYQIKENQKEQEAEVTSAGKKFFKSRPSQLRTYTKR